MARTTNLNTAEEIAEAVRSGQVTATEVTREHLARIDLHDGSLGAFRSVRHGAALAEAEAIDARADRGVLPLAGVPVAIKDNIAVARESRSGTDLRQPLPRRPSPTTSSWSGKGYLATFFAAAKSVPFCQAWNVAGLPAVSVPVGLCDGLPLAVQVVGGAGSELTLLAAAAQIEEVHAPAL